MKTQDRTITGRVGRAAAVAAVLAIASGSPAGAQAPAPSGGAAPAAGAQDRTPAGARGGSANIPAANVGGEDAPPIEITAGIENGAAKCEPADLRIPAGETIDLRVINKAAEQFTISAPEIFRDQNLVRFEGDVAHSAGNEGYIVKQNGLARIIVRTPPAGQYPFTCANIRNYGTPFKGTMTIVESARR
jgi:plastocyanin